MARLRPGVVMYVSILVNRAVAARREGTTELEGNPHTYLQSDRCHGSYVFGSISSIWNTFPPELRPRPSCHQFLSAGNVPFFMGLTNMEDCEFQCRLTVVQLISQSLGSCSAINVSLTNTVARALSVLSTMGKTSNSPTPVHCTVHRNDILYDQDDHLTVQKSPNVRQ